MKKLLGLLLVVLISGVVMASPRTQDDALTDFASYVPADAPIFATMGTDDAAIETLDGVLANLNENLPDDATLPSMEEILSQMFASLPYDLSVALGDKVGLYVTSVDALIFGMGNPLVVMLEMTSQEAGLELVETMTEGLTFTQIELDNGGIFFQPEYNLDTAYVLLDGILFAGAFSPDLSEIITPGEDALSLAQSEAFINAMDSLPADEYNAVVYLDLSDAIATLGPFLGMMAEGMEEVDFNELATLVGQQAFGFAVMEGRSLVMDYVQMSDAYEGSEPLDMALLERVPSTVPLLLHTQEIGSKLMIALDLLPYLDEVIMGLNNDPYAEDISGLGDTLQTFIMLSFEGTFGMPIEEAAAAIDGDMLVYISMDYADSTFMVDNTTIFSNEVPDVTAQLVEEVADMVTESFAPATFEDGVVNTPLGAIFSMPDVLTLSVGSNDDVVAIGGMESVDFALNPGDDNLTTTDSFAFESSMFLPDTYTLLYVDAAPLRAVLSKFVDDNANMFSNSEMRDLQDLMMLLNLVDTASVTNVAGDGFLATRFVLTLAD